jgi:hypothetical protein
MLIQVLIMGECLVVPPLIGTMQNCLHTNAAMMMTMMIRLVAHMGVALNVLCALLQNLVTQTTSLTSSPETM